MTDTPVTDTSLEALKRDEGLAGNGQYNLPTCNKGWNAAIDHIAELIRTGRIRLGGGE